MVQMRTPACIASTPPPAPPQVRIAPKAQSSPAPDLLSRAILGQSRGRAVYPNRPRSQGACGSDFISTSLRRAVGIQVVEVVVLMVVVVVSAPTSTTTVRSPRALLQQITDSRQQTADSRRQARAALRECSYPHPVVYIELPRLPFRRTSTARSTKEFSSGLGGT
jgi:hypothetical protein